MFFYLACFFCFALFLCGRVKGLERLEKKKKRGRDWGETHTSLALGHSRSKTPRSFCQVVSRGKTSDSRDKIGAKYENCLSSHMYLLELVEWIPARSPAVREKYVNSKNVALEILRMFVLISTNHYSIHRWNQMFATSSPYRLHHPDYSRDLSHNAGRGLGIRDDKAHGFYNKFTWKVEK